MNNPESNHNFEPSPIEQAERFKNALGKLDQARQDFLLKNLGDMHITQKDQQELFQRFESMKAEELLSKMDIGELGWFASPQNSIETASDLGGSGDLLIDTQTNEIIRAELTSSNDISSDQLEIDRIYFINPLGRLAIKKTITREKLAQRGEPSMDEDLESVLEPRIELSRLHGASPVELSQLEDDENELDAKTAKTTVDALEKIIDELIGLYHQAGWMINEDTFRSKDNHKVYVIERIDE